MVMTRTSSVSPNNRPIARSYWFHLYTIWLFTLNDIKSIVVPETAFGIFGALSGPLLTTNCRLNLWEVFLRLPKILLWNWLNLLIFDVANQRLEGSIMEDKVNKPWRPIPAQRISASEARRLLLMIIPCVLISMLYLGGFEECVAMLALTWMYNDLEGADESFLTRNAINALGFMCHSSGSTKVAMGYNEWHLSPHAYTWLMVVGSIVFSILQMQDMADVEGDLKRGRRTVPIILGQRIARWSIAIPTIFWSLFCPFYWQISLWAYLPPLITGTFLAYRILFLKSVMDDKGTWKVWCLWTSTLYLLPLYKRYHSS